jgi:hypothetical protein
VRASGDCRTILPGARQPCSRISLSEASTTRAYAIDFAHGLA